MDFYLFYLFTRSDTKKRD